MGAYSTQLIVHANADNTISLGSTRLSNNNGGAPIPIVVFPGGNDRKPSTLAALRSQLAKLDGNSRLYVRGHGNATKQTVGGIGWQEWADTLVSCGLKQVDLISICACRAGQDASVANSTEQLTVDDDFRTLGPNGAMIAHAADSFASKFHRRLGEHGIRALVYARVYRVIVRAGGGGFSAGAKSTGAQTEGIAHAHQRTRSKLAYDWNGALQVRRWVPYGEDATLAAIADLFG
jgi:hypothetical protein